MLRSKTQTKKYLPKTEMDCYENIRHKCAMTLNTYHEHEAGGGSVYIFVADIKIRIANHENVSRKYSQPDFNLVNRDLEPAELEEILNSINFPEYSKQKAFSLHVNISIPKLKKILPEEFYCEIVENPYYFNTKTRVIKIRPALDYLASLGLEDRKPVRQETFSNEDFSGW